MPVRNDDYIQRFVLQMKNKNESPVKKVFVGPGLNQGYSTF